MATNNNTPVSFIDFTAEKVQLICAVMGAEDRGMMERDRFHRKAARPPYWYHPIALLWDGISMVAGPLMLAHKVHIFPSH